MGTGMIIGRFKVVIRELDNNEGFHGGTKGYPHIGAWGYTKEEVVSKIQSQIRKHNQKVIDKFPN